MGSQDLPDSFEPLQNLLQGNKFQGATDLKQPTYQEKN